MTTQAAPLPITANTVHTQPENRVRYPALDGIRAIALCMVFAQHYLHMPWGYTGVDLFFVLSGFLITGILFDTIDRPDRARVFYIRRSLRIFPLYYGLLLLLLVATPVVHFHWSRFWLVWPAYLGNVIRFVRPYSQNPVYISAANGWLAFGNPGRSLNLGHFWSLSLEEQFYLAWPWVVFWVRDRRRLIWICSAVVLAWPFVRIAALAALPVRYTELELTYSFTPLRIDALLIGGLLALLIRGQHRRVVLSFCHRFFLVALPLIALYLCYTLSKPGIVYPSGRLTWVQSIIDLFYTAAVAVALVPGNALYRVCNLRWLRRLGQISYGAYVFHDIPHNLFAECAVHLGRRVSVVAHHQRLSLVVIAAASTIFLAQCSYHFFESPILDLKERWAPSR